MTDDSLPPFAASVSGDSPPGLPESHGASGVAVLFNPLDRRVIGLWRTQQLLLSLALLAVALIGGAIVGFNVPDVWRWIMAGWAVLGLVLLGLLWWYPRRAYRACGWRLDGRVLETRRGIWFQALTLIPLSRLQHIDLNRGPLERMYGLSSLVLYTAGTQYAMVVIPGLDPVEAGRLRDSLVTTGGDDAV